MIKPGDAAPRGGCQCGGRRHSERADAASVRDLLSADFPVEAKAHDGACQSLGCPRRYLAITGFIIGAFLILHLAVNTVAAWPSRFQTFINRLHGLGPVLPALELGLVLAPLSLHVAFGLRTLGREKLKFSVEKHHHGSDVRYWLQRVTAVILLLFLVFHLATMHRWLGGRFDPHNAFASASQAVWRFWPRLAAAHPANFLTAELYLLGIAAAVYHLANGVATGADILGLAPTMQQRRRLWHFCIISGAALGAIGMAAWYAFRDEAIFLQARKPASASLLNEDFTPVNSFHLNSRPQTSLDHHVSI